ncbi:MAG: SDR family oxidoreductase [Candidatus Eremiobacteraeota bacterium]|nr:SDR family oxidoreductase [Candidatus Eremiobacteraeota bacterium]
MSQLTHQIILVTGANRGIGKAIVAEALNRGSKKVYAAVRDLESAEPLVKEFGSKVVPIELDLSKPKTIIEAAQNASDVTVVVNNAGALTMTTALDEDAVSSLEYLVDVNVSGFIRVAQAFAPVLKDNNGGVLAQVNSVVSTKAFPTSATYSASKAASYAVTQALREQLRPQGTKVVSIHPGPIATDMGKEAGMENIAEPPSVVAEAFFDALENGAFHVFPDTMAQQIWEQYRGYAENVIEPELQLAAH